MNQIACFVDSKTGNETVKHTREFFICEMHAPWAMHDALITIQSGRIESVKGSTICAMPRQSKHTRYSRKTQSIFRCRFKFLDANKSDAFSVDLMCKCCLKPVRQIIWLKESDWKQSSEWDQQSHSTMRTFVLNWPETTLWALIRFDRRKIFANYR